MAVTIMKRFASGSVMLLILSVANLAQAALIVEFNFDDLDGLADDIGTHVSSSSFEAGSGLVNESFSSSEAAARGWISASGSPGAIGQAKYWEFVVTADPGYHLNLSNVTFDEHKGSSGPVNFQLSVNDILVGSSLAPSTTSTAHNLDLSQFNGLSSATVRFFAWNAANNGVNSDWNVDNVELNGAAAPEPSALLLATVLAPGLALLRRRKRRPEND